MVMILVIDIKIISVNDDDDHGDHGDRDQDRTIKNLNAEFKFQFGQELCGQSSPESLHESP